MWIRGRGDCFNIFLTSALGATHVPIPLQNFRTQTQTPPPTYPSPLSHARAYATLFSSFAHHSETMTPEHMFNALMVVLFGACGLIIRSVLTRLSDLEKQNQSFREVIFREYRDHQETVRAIHDTITSALAPLTLQLSHLQTQVTELTRRVSP